MTLGQVRHEDLAAFELHPEGWTEVVQDMI